MSWSVLLITFSLCSCAVALLPHIACGTVRMAASPCHSLVAVTAIFPRCRQRSWWSASTQARRKFPPQPAKQNCLSSSQAYRNVRSPANKPAHPNAAESNQLHRVSTLCRLHSTPCHTSSHNICASQYLVPWHLDRWGRRGQSPLDTYLPSSLRQI